jgi:hypothetical protein
MDCKIDRLVQKSQIGEFIFFDSGDERRSANDLPIVITIAHSSAEVKE